MRANSFKRIGAYLIDMLVVILITNVIVGFIPRSKEYEKVNEESAIFVNEYFEVVSKGDTDKVVEYADKLNDISYQLTKHSVVTSSLSIVIYVLYFIVFQRYNNGQTVGKKILKLEVVDLEGNTPSYKNLIIRSVILYNLVFALVDIILVLILSKGMYIGITNILSYVQMAISIGCFVTLFTKNPLHDRLAGTRVIDFGTIEEVEESNVSRWKKISTKEKEVKKYRSSHTSGKRKE